MAVVSVTLFASKRSFKLRSFWGDIWFVSTIGAGGVGFIVLGGGDVQDNAGDLGECISYSWMLSLSSNFTFLFYWVSTGVLVLRTRQTYFFVFSMYLRCYPFLLLLYRLGGILPTPLESCCVPERAAKPP